MNAFWWSVAEPVACVASLTALVIVGTRPGARRVLWSLRTRLAAWNGASAGAVTPAGGGRWEDAAYDPATVAREAPAIEMGVYIDDADEDALAALSDELWPDGEYSEIVLAETRLWRRAVRRLRRRAGVAS